MKNKNILITGGANGLGESLAIMFENQGYNVIIIDKDNEKLNQIKKIYPKIDTHICDVSDFASLIKTTHKILLKYKHIHYLINNAAIQYIESLETLDFNHWEEVFNVNLKAPMYLIKEIASCMKENDQILNISSVHGLHPRLNKYAYDASKAGLNLMTKETALALAEKGIRVNALMIGATKTQMNNMFSHTDELKNSIKKIPLNRVASTEDLTKFVSYLFNEDTYATGSIFTIDGGRSIFTI